MISNNVWKVGASLIGIAITSCLSSGIMHGGTALFMSTKSLIGWSWAVAKGVSAMNGMVIRAAIDPPWLPSSLSL